MVTQSRTVSVEEFMALPDDGNRHELVRGEVRIMPPPKGIHGKIEIRLLAAIDHFIEERARALGWTPDQGGDARDRLVGFVAGGEFGVRFSVPDDPNQIRGADGAYVPAEQYAQITWPDDAYFPGVPQLVIEVISGSESPADVAETVQDYLAGGARRVWCVYPQRRAIQIYEVDGPTRMLRAGDTLTDEELLPGFSLQLNRIF